MILSHYPSAQGPRLPVCMVLGEKTPQDKHSAAFFLIHPRTCLENLKVKVGQIQSPCTFPCTSLLLLYGFKSQLKAGVCRLDAVAQPRGSSGRIPSPPRLAPAMPSGRASTGAEHHMPKPPRGFARGHVKEPCEQGHSSCCRQSVGGRGGGARGRDVGRRSQKGQISSQRRSCRGATGLAANWEGL